MNCSDQGYDGIWVTEAGNSTNIKLVAREVGDAMTACPFLQPAQEIRDELKLLNQKMGK